MTPLEARRGNKGKLLTGVTVLQTQCKFGEIRVASPLQGMSLYTVFTNLGRQKESLRKRASRKCQGPGVHCKGKYPVPLAKSRFCIMKNALTLNSTIDLVPMYSLLSLASCSVFHAPLAHFPVEQTVCSFNPISWNLQPQTPRKGRQK